MNYQKIIKNIETQLKEYLGNKKAVIGISGGIDSAVVAALAVRAIGKQNILGISMPYKNQDTSDAQLVIDNLEINSKEINIGKIIDSNIRKLEQALGKEIDKITNCASDVS
jgi:NAD+ synthase